MLKDGEDPLNLTDRDWKERLTPSQYEVCREKGTEREILNISYKLLHIHSRLDIFLLKNQVSRYM